MAVIQGISIPTYKSTQEEWVLFYRRLRDKYKKIDADEIFITAFNQNAEDGLRNNADFRAKMAKLGLEISGEGIGGFLSDFAPSNLLQANTSRMLIIALVAVVGLWFAFKLLPQGRALSAMAAMKQVK